MITRTTKLPTNWQFLPVGNLCESIVPGRDKPKVFDGTIPWITTPDITTNRASTSRSGLKVSLSELKRCKGKTIPECSVIMSCVGEFGLVALSTNEIVINQQLHAFVPSKRVYPEYLMYALKFQKGWMDRFATTTAVPYLNKTNCEAIPIPLPPLPEQKKIAEILSCWDLAIERLEKLIEAKRRFKKGVMADFFSGNCDSTSDTKQTPLGRFPKDWHICSVGDCGRVITGRTPPTKDKENYDGEIPFISPVDLGETKYVSSGQKSLSKEGVKKANLIPKNSLLFTCIGSTIGKIGLASVDLATNQQINSVIPTEQVAVEFLYYWLLHRRDSIRILAGTQAVPIINKTLFESVPVLIPPKEVQSRLITTLSLLDSELDFLGKYKSNFTLQKRALMQQLLTGKIRVNTSDLQPPHQEAGHG